MGEARNNGEILAEGADYAAIAQVVRGASTFAVCGHVNPDGDSVGSVLGMVALLRSLGKSVTPLLANASHAPAKYAFLEGHGDFIHATRFSKRVDVFVSVDTPTVERMGDSYEMMRRAATSISLDHHPEAGVGADLWRRDVGSSSASMMVWDLAKELTDGHPGAAVANACYTGIVTDTGCFQFQNSNARALLAASEMVLEGASPAQVCTEVFQSRKVAAIRLEGRIIERLRVSDGGKVAWSWILESDYDELGVAKEDTEGLVDTVRSVKSIEVAILAQSRKNDIRCSIRGKRDFDVSEIAREYGGGGHRAAAGFTLAGTLPAKMSDLSEMVDEIDARVEGFLRDGGEIGGHGCQDGSARP